MTQIYAKPPRNKESETLEYQREASVQALAPSIVAMLNHRGGVVFAGYSDTGKCVGLAGNGAALAQRLTEELSQAITPKEFFQVTLQEGEGKIGLVIEVPAGVRKPYVYDGRIYVREGASDRPATAAVISRLIGERENTDGRWERRPAVGVEANMLDMSEIQKTTAVFGRRYTLPRLKQEPAAAQLDRLDLMQDGWPTQAAFVLFRTGPITRSTQAGLRAVSFNNTLAEIRDEKIFSGGAFLLFERVLGFLEANLPSASFLEPGTMQRTERPTYPATVLREAVVNALMHRDYQDQALIQVRLFPARLEIWNPGTLPEEYIQEEALFTVSRPRNPDIARVFHLRGYAEMLGIGLRRIREEMTQAGLPPPTWKNEAGGVLLTLSRPPQELPLQKPAQEELPSRLQTFLAATKPGETITREEYQNRFAPGVSERSARNDLQALQKQGYLRPTGQGYLKAYVRTEQTINA